MTIMHWRKEGLFLPFKISSVPQAMELPVYHPFSKVLGQSNRGEDEEKVRNENKKQMDREKEKKARNEDEEQMDREEEKKARNKSKKLTDGEEGKKMRSGMFGLKPSPGALLDTP
ncbi:hypothetical protein NDU88_000265 [Pleurodeles waltl]|uniref:Uncharacterized protein n=1 Tax=Pleurodeles waltl TaxID=8319 RepID=A0AAV7UQA6_PLEWA|nr:hypothetical protein NDU88_000265 [Pleurodeles waltl]